MKLADEVKKKILRDEVKRTIAHEIRVADALERKILFHFNDEHQHPENLPGRDLQEFINVVKAYAFTLELIFYLRTIE